MADAPAIPAQISDAELLAAKSTMEKLVNQQLSQPIGATYLRPAIGYQFRLDAAADPQSATHVFVTVADVEGTKMLYAFNFRADATGKIVELTDANHLRLGNLK